MYEIYGIIKYMAGSYCFLSNKLECPIDSILLISQNWSEPVSKKPYLMSDKEIL